MLMFYLSTIVRLSSILVLSVVVASILSDNLLADADEDHIAQLKGWKVSVAPASFSYDDEITITISGLPRYFPFVDKNALTLNGFKVKFPMSGKGPDALPRTGDDGNLVFTTNIPDGLRSGPHYLRVDIPNIFVARTPVYLKPLTLRVSSSNVVPYQEVWVVGTGFTKTPRAKGTRPITINEMYLEIGSSEGVTIDGELVSELYIEFPVTLGKNGSAFFKMIVPESESTTTPGQIELKVTDSEGREGVATLTVLPTELDIGNHISYPGETVSFDITGLPAYREGSDNDLEMIYGYATNLTGTRHVAVQIGSFDVDAFGTVSGEFLIPKEALLSSSNRIWVRGLRESRWEFNHYLGGKSISSEPTSGLPGDPVRITIKGMPRNYPLVPGSVSLGGNRLDVPGLLGKPGDKPVSTDIGLLTFMSKVPNVSQPGYRTITWDPPGAGTVSTTFYVMEGRLHFNPPSVTPGQMVTVSSESNSEKVRGVRISGSNGSYVSIDGVDLLNNDVDYPILLAEDGRFDTTFQVPIDREIIAKDSVEISTTDTSGRKARGTLYLRRESVTVTPLESVRGSRITVEGSGFFANAKRANSSHRVLISYRGVQIESVILDETGEFKTSFNVPATAVVGGQNQITTVLEGWPSVRVYSNHRVPGAAAQVTPGIASSGEHVVLIGTGFTPFRQITIVIGHLWASDVGPCDARCDLVSGQVHTDMLGAFKVFVEVPQGLPKGSLELIIYAPYPVEVARVPFLMR